MKYTEKWFGFPVRVHNEVFKEEEIDEGEYNMGMQKIPHLEIFAWSDYYDEDGIKLTLVETYTLGQFLCSLKRKEFEARLDAYVEKYGDSLQQEYTDKLVTIMKKGEKNSLL